MMLAMVVPHDVAAMRTAHFTAVAMVGALYQRCAVIARIRMIDGLRLR